jgi:hypothetical protein
MRTTPILIAVAVAIMVATAAKSHSDTSSAESSTSSSGAAPEAITGSAVAPNPGSETPMRDPFTLYAHDQPSETLWTYNRLTAAERLVVDRGLASDSSPVNTAYARAANQRTAAARAEAAATRLGADNLDSTGVVP